MDHENYEEICNSFISAARPRVHMVMDFVNGRSGEEITDPYYGTDKEFERVMNDLFVASEQSLSRLFEEYPDVALQVSGE